jgi:hypothetical protein
LLTDPFLWLPLEYNKDEKEIFGFDNDRYSSGRVALESLVAKVRWTLVPRDWLSIAARFRTSWGVLILHSDRSRAVHSRSLAPALGGIAGLRPQAYQAAVGMGVQTVVTSLAEGFSGSCK